VKTPYKAFGFNIATNALLTEAGPDEERTRIRSWKERLFTWPWRPWQKTATHMAQTQVPSRQVYRIRDTLVMHPSMLEEIKRQLEEMK
jgi:hypothetical protein